VAFERQRREPPTNVVRKIRPHPELFVANDPQSMVAERYRSLSIKLAAKQRDADSQVIVITSAAPVEGKTLTATNVALATAESGAHPTLLIDADLRRPTLSLHLQPPAGVGLAEVLAGTASLKDALCRIQDTNLWVLPAGAVTEKPLALLQPERLDPFLARLRTMFDLVVVDTPPVVPYSDANRIGMLADGVILVVRAGQTTKPVMDRALESLQGTKILGAVLTDTRTTLLDRYYYSYDENEPYAARAAR
jgi:receptor protein-tyrosine kinase